MKYSTKKQAAFLLHTKMALGTPRIIAKAQGQICSMGSKRVYAQHLSGFIQYLHDNDVCKPRDVTEVNTTAFLEQRSCLVKQKTLDADRQSLQLAFNMKLPYVPSKLKTILYSRAYNSMDVKEIRNAQEPSNQFATDIVMFAGLRAHELITIAPATEQPKSIGREWPENLFFGMAEIIKYTVIGKGGLIREVALSIELAEQLENRRLLSPRFVVDRGIKYLQKYDISYGQRWSQSFTEASSKTLGFSRGGHGLRHRYAQERLRTILRLGIEYPLALQIISSELGHFRKEITEIYLR